MKVVPVREIGTLHRDMYRIIDPRRVASPARAIFLEALAEQSTSPAPPVASRDPRQPKTK
jgi:hypothetical protein